MDILRQAGLTPGPLIVTFLLTFTSITLLFWYSSRKLNYWKKRGVPFPKSMPFIGSVLEAFRKPFHEVELIRYQKFGRIYGYYEGNRPALSVGEPEILRNILVKDFAAFTGKRIVDTGDKVIENMMAVLRGEDWKRVRTIVTPTFTMGKIKRVLSIFQECSRTVVKNFKESSEKGEPVDVRSLYGAFTMDIIASAAFSTKIDSHNDPNNKFVLNARSIFGRNINWRFVLFVILPGVMKLFRISVLDPKISRFYTNVILQIIEDRKRTGQTRNDFLQLLLDITEDSSKEGKLDLNEKDEIAENYRKLESDQAVKNNYSKKTLSQDELVAQCFAFFLAGYDTTAATLSLLSYELALNPDIQEKLIKELDDALKANEGKLTYEAVQSMKYLDNVIAETLRMYPPLVRNERMADEDYKLGDTGLIIPKGMIISIPIYAMHRDPKLFPNPEKFDPDRFTPEERVKRDPYSYMPFSAGPRNCVGMRFALMEIKVCLAHVLSNFRIKKCEKTQIPIDFYLGQVLLQPKSITLLMEVRKDAVNSL